VVQKSGLLDLIKPCDLMADCGFMIREDVLLLISIVCFSQHGGSGWHLLHYLRARLILARKYYWN